MVTLDSDVLSSLDWTEEHTSFLCIALENKWTLSWMPDCTFNPFKIKITFVLVKHKQGRLISKTENQYENYEVRIRSSHPIFLVDILQLCLYPDLYAQCLRWGIVIRNF